MRAALDLALSDTNVTSCSTKQLTRVNILFSDITTTYIIHNIYMLLLQEMGQDILSASWSAPELPGSNEKSCQLNRSQQHQKVPR